MDPGDPDDPDLPAGADDEKTLLLDWLSYLRGAVRRNLGGLDDSQARWTPEGRLIPLIGIVVHLTSVEWRWIDGGFAGTDVNRSEQEFTPGTDVTVDDALAAYEQRAVATEDVVRNHDLDQVSGTDTWAEGHDLRWVLLHLINETARHAGHADAVRELLDGATGE